MASRRKSWQVTIAILSLIAPILIVQTALPSPAQARCSAQGSPETSRLYQPNGAVALTEQALSTTCNGDSIYSFRFRTHVDGYRAAVWMYIDGDWEVRAGGFNQNWHYATFTDDDSVASMFYCMDVGNLTYYCGVGHRAGFFFGDPTDNTNYTLNLGF